MSYTTATVLSTVAYHVGELMSCTRPKFRAGLAYSGLDVLVTVEIEPCPSGDTRWDRCRVNGEHVGNRCAARETLVALYAPIVAAVARDELASMVASQTGRAA